MLGAIADRVVAGLLTLVASLLLAWPRSASRARVAWIVLIGIGTAYGLALNLQPRNFPNGNFSHYYLGAKYPVPYGETYRLFHAGIGREQIGMRDLERPSRRIGSSLYAQRAYYIDLLRATGVTFDPLAPLDTLTARARDAGLIEAQARRILAARLPANRIADYRRDVGWLDERGLAFHMSGDYGYNGSPFYGLLRRLDPTLYMRLGLLPALAGLAWQLLGVLLIAWLSGPVLGFSMVERLAVAGLVVVSAEFTNYGMPGLEFTEVWVPVLLAALALRRGRPALSGLAIAVAGLLKIFPFLMTLAVAVPLARSLGPGASEADAPRRRQRRLALLAACAAAALGLGLLSLLSGRTWVDFLHKIQVEFVSGSNMINSVSAAAALAALGVPEGSPLYWLVPLAGLVPLLALFWNRRAGESGEVLARRAVILVAAMGWLVRSWLNYYAVVPFILLPLVARRRRGLAVAMAASMAGTYLLPGFDALYSTAGSLVHALKVVPYLAVPAGLVWLELREDGWPRWAVRLAAVTAILLALATTWETWRGREIRRLAEQAEASLESGDAAVALGDYDRLARLLPRDARIQRRHAVAQAMLGRLDEALPDFARAVALDPEDVAARDDYARALLMSGRLGEAVQQIEAAHALDPTEVQILFQLARMRLAQGRRAEAIALLARARELAPEEPAIAEALRRVAGP